MGKRILLPQDESLHLLPFLVYWALKAHKKGRSKDSYTRSLDTFSLHFFFNRSSRTRRNEVNGKCIVEILYAWPLLLQKLFVIFLIWKPWHDNKTFLSLLLSFFQACRPTHERKKERRKGAQ